MKQFPGLFLLISGVFRFCHQFSYW